MLPTIVQDKESKNLSNKPDFLRVGNFERINNDH